METIDGIVFANRETDSQVIALLVMPGRHLYRRGEGRVTDFLIRHGSDPKVVVVLYVDDMEEVDAIYEGMSQPDGWTGVANGPYTLDTEGPEAWESIFAFQMN